MVEVLIAAAMLGGISLGFMHLQKSASTAKTESNFSIEMFQITNQLQQQFLNGYVCSDSLQTAGNISAPISEASDGSWVTLPSVQFQPRDIDGTPVGAARLIFDPTVDLRSEFQGGRLKLKSMTIVNKDITPVPSDPKIEKADLKIRFEFAKRKSKGETVGERVIYRHVNINAMVAKVSDAALGYTLGEVFKCFSTEGNAVTTSLKEACESRDAFSNLGATPMITKVFDPADGSCKPKYVGTDPSAITSESYCIYGGSFSSGAFYKNPETNDYTCRTGFSKVRSGHFTRPKELTCGKGKCYKFYQQPFYTCVKCYGEGSGTNAIADSGNMDGYSTGSGGGWAACVDTVTIADCGPSEYPEDTTGNGCENACVDYSGYIP